MPMPTVPGGGFRKDFLDIIDFICVDDHQTIGVQSCGQAFVEHKKKIYGSDNTNIWLSRHRELWLIGWRKLKVKRGGKATKWTPRIEIMRYEI